MKKKILFVTHALEGLYGSATSLRLLLEHYSGIEADLILPRSFRHSRDLNTIAARFPSVRSVHELSLPVDLDVVGIKRSKAELLYGAAHWLNWQRDRVRFRDLIAQRGYDVVHFNSPVLHRMVEPGMPALTHMRDIILDPNSPVVDKLSNGLGIVFIDAATRKPFERVIDCVQSITLNNPMHMSDVGQYAGGFRHPRITANTTVFSMLGRVSPIKGVELVIRAFRQGAGDDALLLIVGDGPKDYVAQCRTQAGADPRIVFWGEEANAKKIYAATDYVVRGDPQPCIGRTVYEGLYCGCRVIMAGLGAADFIFEADRFQESVELYHAGDSGSLAKVFASCTGKKILARQYLSNVEEYVRAFDGFLDKCLSR
jgi:glycosyltransferase involved in cell wall biosynthesis